MIFMFVFLRRVGGVLPLYLREPLAHDLPLVEVVFYRSDLLIGFMPLAAEDDHIAAPRLRKGKADGPAPVFDDGKGRSALHQPRQRVAQDGVGVLGARVIARKNGKVRQRRGDTRHAGALRLVAVSPAAKERDHAPIGKGSDRGEVILEPVWCVGIVDDDGERRGKRLLSKPRIKYETEEECIHEKCKVLRSANSRRYRRSAA